MAEIAQYTESNALIVNSFFLIFGSFSTKVVLWSYCTKPQQNSRDGFISPLKTLRKKT